MPKQQQQTARRPPSYLTASSRPPRRLASGVITRPTEMAVYEVLTPEGDWMEIKRVDKALATVLDVYSQVQLRVRFESADDTERKRLQAYWEY